MHRSRHILLLLYTWTMVSCTSMSSLNDELHSGVDGWIGKSSDYAGSLDKDISQTLNRWEYNSEAYLTALRDDADSLIERWVSEGRYGLALATIDQVRKAHPKYALLQERRPGIAAQARRYEADIIQQARQHVKKQQWDQAILLYEQALSRLPESHALREGMQTVHDKQAAHITHLQRRLLISDGNKLLETIRFQQDALKINPRDKLARQRLEKHRRKAKRLAQDLYSHGLKALDGGRLEDARQALGLTVKLDGNIDTKQAFDTLQDKEARTLLQQGRTLLKQGKLKKARHTLTRSQRLHDNANTRAALTALQRVENQRVRKRLDKLNKQYDQALAAGRLLQAKALLAQMKKMKVDATLFRDLQQDLDHRLSETINHHLSLGIRHYSNDRFEQAIRHWNKVLELEPNHERARQRLERTQRIVNKLEELRRKQQP